MSDRLRTFGQPGITGIKATLGGPWLETILVTHNW
jgi:hypothetical protein